MTNDQLLRVNEDVGCQIAAESQGCMNFIIGNYNEENLVASLLAYKMGVTQCNMMPDIYWKKFEDKHHSSSQFTVDLMVVNKVNFILPNMN